MKLVMKDTKFWRSCIGVIADLISEAAFKVTPTGLKMKAMDPSHVALVDFEFPSNAFNEFMVDKPITLNIDLAEMNKIMARAKLEDELTLELDSSENRLILTFKGDSTRRFTMPLIDIDETDVPEPKLKFTAYAEVAANVLQDGLKDAELYNDIVKFELANSRVLIKGMSESGESELTLDRGSPDLLKLDVSAQAVASFNIGFLLKMVKAASATDAIKVSMGTNLPILLEYSVEKKGELKFLLAPRAETE